MSFYSFPKHKRVAEKAGRFMATLKTAPSTSPDFYKRKQEQVRRIAEKIGERERREFRKNRAFVDGKARPSQDYVDSVKKQFWEDYEQGKIPKSTNVNKTANDVKKGFESLAGGFSEAGKKRVAELVSQQGYVEYGIPEAQEAFRKTYTGWDEQVRPDGKIRFKPPTPEYQEFLDWKKSNTSSPTPTVDVKPATNQPSPQRTPKSFAEELASGKNLNSPEDLQFYQNNASAIEKELTSMAEDVKSFKDKDIVPDEPKTSQKPSEPEVTTKTAEPEKTTVKPEPAPETVEAKKPPSAPEPSASPKPTPTTKPAPTPSQGTGKIVKAPASFSTKGMLVKGGIAGAVAAGLYFLLKPSSSKKQPNGVLTNNTVNDIQNVQLQNNFTVSKFATGNASVRRMNGCGPVYQPYGRRTNGSRCMGGY